MIILQIQSFIQSLGLDNVSPVKERQGSSSAPTVESEEVKGNRGAKTSIIEGYKPLDKADKKKKRKKKDTEVANAAVSGGSSESQMVDEGVNGQLRHLSVKSYKKLLVSMDNEVMWYDLVSTMCIHVLAELLSLGEGFSFLLIGAGPEQWSSFPCDYGCY